MLTFRTLLVLLFLKASLCYADDQLGHSKHGEAFNEGPRQAAELMEGLPEAVQFPITTHNHAAQLFFSQGVTQLHGYWYYEAERSFRMAALLDAESAMPYWGMTMANIKNEKRAKGFLAKTVERKAKANEREKKWIAVLEKFYRESKDDKRDKKQRQQDAITDFEALVQDYPDDIEAKAFLVWKIYDAHEQIPISSPQAVDALLDQIFAKAPHHPAHHYRIHLWDEKKAERALKSAALCGPAAPSIAHMWHMPGHTYSKLKRYDDAAWQQEAATRIDHAHMRKTLIHPDQIHNYAHNEEWLIRTWNELGRANDAIALAKALIANPCHPSYNTLSKASSSASFGRKRLIETLIQWELWPQLLALKNSPELAPTTERNHEIERLHAYGLAHYALKESAALAEMVKALGKVKAPSPSKDKTKEKNKKPDAKTLAVAELKVLQLILQKKPKQALAELNKIKDLPKLRSIRYYMTLGDKKQAAELAKQLPENLIGRSARAEVLQQLGQEAKPTFKEVRKLAYSMDQDLPIYARMQALAKQLGYSASWILPKPEAKDQGKRPELASLGPVHWQPPLAPDWEGTSEQGQPMSSKDHTGKNTLLLFYVGHECKHCMQQLVAFTAQASEFQKLGIQLLAISPDKQADLAKAHKFAPDKKAFPFPLISAKSESIFSRYRAYDDFEKMPLHAVAFIDNRNQLRWLDVSYQPFTDAEFVLAECQRLLRMTSAPTLSAKLSD